MGFRFRNSFRLVPGLRINIGLKSASASVGTRGLWYTIGTAGRRFTAGIPGSGLSWTTSASSPSTSSRAVLWIAAAVVATVLFLMAVTGLYLL